MDDDIDYAVVHYEGVFGVRGTYVAVPWDALRFTDERNRETDRGRDHRGPGDTPREGRFRRGEACGGGDRRRARWRQDGQKRIADSCTVYTRGGAREG